jgi:hypothetical protein
VRLAYAGVELDPSKDGSPFKINPKITMLQCMMRMKGGGARSTAKASSTAPALETTRSPATSGSDAPSPTAAAATSRRRPKLMQRRRASEPAVAAVTAAAAAPAVSAVEVAPGAGVGGSAEVQLAKQLRHIMRHPIPGVSVAPDESDEMTWHVKVIRMVTNRLIMQATNG